LSSCRCFCEEVAWLCRGFAGWQVGRFAGPPADFCVGDSVFEARSSELGVRSSEFGVRGSEFGVRSSELGARVSVLVIRSLGVFSLFLFRGLFGAVGKGEGWLGGSRARLVSSRLVSSLWASLWVSLWVSLCFERSRSGLRSFFV
jgi:hypothetical protein